MNSTQTSKINSVGDISVTSLSSWANIIDNNRAVQHETMIKLLNRPITSETASDNKWTTWMIIVIYKDFMKTKIKNF